MAPSFARTFGASVACVAVTFCVAGLLLAATRAGFTVGPAAIALAIVLHTAVAYVLAFLVLGSRRAAAINTVFAYSCVLFALAAFVWLVAISRTADDFGHIHIP